MDRGAAKSRTQRDSGVCLRKSRSQQKVSKSFNAVRQTSDSEEQTSAEILDHQKSATTTQPPPPPPPLGLLKEEAPSSSSSRQNDDSTPKKSQVLERPASQGFDAVVDELKTKLSKLRSKEGQHEVKAGDAAVHLKKNETPQFSPKGSIFKPVVSCGSPVTKIINKGSMKYDKVG